MSEREDLLQVEGINSKGFGTIPKLLMQDKRISAEAKAIYAYFCSFCGGGLTAFPRRTKIITDLGMSKTTYYKHFAQLKDYGYIRVEQERDNTGRYVRSLYTLVQIVPCPKNQDTERFQQPSTKKWDTDSAPCPNLRCTDNWDTAIYRNNINSLNINTLSSQSETTDGQGESFQQATENLITIIRKNIGYTDFQQSHPYDMKLIDEIISIIVDAMLTKGKYVCIDGQSRPRTLVRRQLALLDYTAVEHVVGQFKGLTKRIKKKRQYLLSMLYNVTLEFDAHYTNLVASDQGGGRDRRGSRW